MDQVRTFSAILKLLTLVPIWHITSSYLARVLTWSRTGLFQTNCCRSSLRLLRCFQSLFGILITRNIQVFSSSFNEIVFGLIFSGELYFGFYFNILAAYANQEEYSQNNTCYRGIPVCICLHTKF